MFVSLDRRLLLVQTAIWCGWLVAVCVVWLPQGEGLSVLVITGIAAAGGATLRLMRLASVEKLVDLQSQLEETTRQREAALQRAREAEKLESLGVMAAGVAHDYNNLLVGVVGGVDLAMVAKNDPELREALETIRVSADALVGLSEQLLEVAGGRPILRSCVDLNEVIQDTLKALSPMLGHQRRVCFQPAAHLPEVFGEPDSLRQIVLNLLTNALHYSSAADNAVEIGVKTVAPPGKSEMVLLWVEDDGPGVPEALRSRIYDPFFSTNDAARGLGLSTTRTIVRRHDGEISVGQGARGARFEVRLPVSELPHPAAHTGG